MADLSSDIYTNTRKELFYVMVEFDTKQSDIPVLHVSKKPPYDRTTRYDAQYALISELR